MNKHLSYILPIILIVLLYFGGQYAYKHYRYLLDVTIPITAIILIALHINITRFITELNAKLQIKRQFGGYVSPVIVERLQKNPELIKLGGEEKELSIVMTDMRNFTALGESYGERVEDFTITMNRYMTAISDPILTNDGCLIKFIGDASLHVHGAPLNDDQHALHSVKTAIEMIKAVELFNIELKKENRPPVGMGIGINTGLTLIGNIGSRTRFGYDILGDSVSLAARLEGQSKPYGVKIVLGPKTAEQVMDEYFVLELDKIAVKGKRVGVTIYTVLELYPGAHGDYEMGRLEHDAMLQCYRDQKFDDAIMMCNNLSGEFDGQMNGYYTAWRDRCREMKSTKLPPNWDGTYVATSK